MEIGGSNFQMGRRRTADSYYFSRYCCAWGWATWRRAWTHFDVNLNRWPELRDAGFLDQVLDDPVERRCWRTRFDNVHAGNVTWAWDWQWLFAMWRQHGLSVVPETNLVTNIGFGPDSTNFKSFRPKIAFQERREIGELLHPVDVFANREADRFIFDYCEEGMAMRGTLGSIRPAFRKLLNRAKRRFSRKEP